MFDGGDDDEDAQERRLKAKEMKKKEFDASYDHAKKIDSVGL